MHQLELPGISRDGHLRACLDWLVDHALECGYWTRRMHADHARYLVEYFGDVPIRSIRYQGIRDYYTHELARKLSRESIRKRLCTLKMALDEARRRELIDNLPPWVVIKTDSRPKEGFWTLSQWESVHAVCDDEDFRTWIAAGFWTGMRSADLNRWRWDDVDLWKKTWIRYATKSSRKPRAVAPKTLPLPDRFHAVLLERFGRLQPHPRDLVAGRNMGHPNRPIKEMAHRAGVPLISPHGLRHSCETYLYESGADEAFQQTWLGLSSPAQLKTYRHQTDQTIDRGLAALNARAAGT